MPGQPVATQYGTNALALGVSSAYWEAYYQRQQASLQAPLGRLVMEIPATADQIKLAAFQAAAPPVFWPRGRPISSKAFKDLGLTIRVDTWGTKVTWNRDDAADDQTGSLVAMGRNAGDLWYQRDDANWFQVFNASTDSDGLPAALTAMDGAACFSATDGGSAARFGVTGGNIVSGQSFASGAGIRAGYQAALSRMFQFQNPESQPLLDPGAKNFIVFAAAADLAAVNEAFKQQMVLGAASTATSNGGVTNVIADAGYNVTLNVTQRLATGVMVVACTDVPVKPLIRAKRSDPEENPINMTNSDESRLTRQEGIQFHARTGYGVGLPFGLIKVTT